MLSFAVFVWGLQYKVSLYHSLAAQHSIPAAKLLSQRERPLTHKSAERLMEQVHLRLRSAVHPTVDHGALTMQMCVLCMTYVAVAFSRTDGPDGPSVAGRGGVSPRGPPAFA
jgi:hypothetical protein